MATCPLLWFPIYAAEMLSDEDFMSWSPAERGCWITLSARCWADGSIPEDIERMARLCGCNAEEMLKHWSSIASKFSKHSTPGRLISKRIEEERELAIGKAEKLSKRGKAGAAARWVEEKGEMLKHTSSNTKAMLDDATNPTQPNPNNPLPPTGSGEGVKQVRKPIWTKAHPEEVIKATQEIKAIWPRPEDDAFQPDGKTLVPGVSPSELASRLAEIRALGAELDICVKVAARVVSEWKAGKWIKAPQHFFGKAKDSPFRAYYQAYVTNEAVRMAS